MLKWEWHDNPNTLSVFVHLLLMANHEPNKWHGISIERGQVLTSLAKLSKECGISIRNLRTCLNRLKSTNEITQSATSKYSIITICKYDSYQSQTTSERHNQRHNQRQASDTQATTNKKEKKDKNLKENIIKEMSEEEQTFLRGMATNYPSVMSLSNPLGYEEYIKLIEAYGVSLVTAKLQAMENYKDLKKKKSAFLTCNEWCRKEAQK